MNANRLVGEYSLALLTSAQKYSTVLIVFFTHPESSLNTLWVIGFVDPAGGLFHAVNPMYIPRASRRYPSHSTEKIVSAHVSIQTEYLLWLCSHYFHKKTF